MTGRRYWAFAAARTAQGWGALKNRGCEIMTYRRGVCKAIIAPVDEALASPFHSA
jgi:hypothetical protein